MTDPAAIPNARRWAGYYRWTAHRPPRELLLRTFDHLDWRGPRRGRSRRAVDLGFGAGTDSLELLRRGWSVVAVDQQPTAARLLTRRTPRRLQDRLTIVVAPFEGLQVPRADLVYASFSLPFCVPAAFPALWREIHRSLAPGGTFAGQLFGDRDEWAGRRPMSFHTRAQLRRLLTGYEVELLRETEEEGQSYEGPKHWHLYDLILRKPGRPAAKS